MGGLRPLFDRLAGVGELPKVSADGAWLAYDGCDGGLEIHSWKDAIRYRLNEPRVVDFYWAAQSPELYLSVGEGPISTVVVELPYGGVRVINPEAGLGGWYWLPKTP